MLWLAIVFFPFQIGISARCSPTPSQSAWPDWQFQLPLENFFFQISVHLAQGTRHDNALYECTFYLFTATMSKSTKVISVLNNTRYIFTIIKWDTSSHLCGSVAEWLGRWTCNQQVTGSKPGLPAVECNPGQVASVTKQYNLVPANGRWCLAAGKVTVGLASHWPRVTDISGSPPTGSRPRRGRWAPAYALLVEYSELCLCSDLEWPWMVKLFWRISIIMQQPFDL